MTLRSNLEHFLRSFLGMLYIISKLKKSNASNGVQIEAEMKKLWSLEYNWTELKEHFEFKMGFRNSTYDFEIRINSNFEITYYNFDISPPPPRELHLWHSINPKQAPHNWKSRFQFSYFQVIIWEINDQQEHVMCQFFTFSIKTPILGFRRREEERFFHNYRGRTSL